MTPNPGTGLGGDWRLAIGLIGWKCSRQGRRFETGSGAIIAAEAAG